MAYLNINNICSFEGRLIADPELSYLPSNGGQQGLPKCRFKVAVDRNMTKEAKQKAQAEGKETADFVPLEILGQRAEFVANNFSKGKGIRVVSSFKTFSYTKDGQTNYGYNFDVVDVGYCLGGSGNGNNGQNNNNGNAQGFEPMGLDPQGFQAIDDDDLPF